jgi:hypothetical protein
MRLRVAPADHARGKPIGAHRSCPSSLVASAWEVRDGDQDLGSLEEGGGLPACVRAGGAVRWLQVHVPATRARRLQVGPRADPVVSHLRRVHRSAHNRRLTGTRRNQFPQQDRSAHDEDRPHVPAQRQDTTAVRTCSNTYGPLGFRRRQSVRGHRLLALSPAPSPFVEALSRPGQAIGFKRPVTTYLDLRGDRKPARRCAVRK